MAKALDESGVVVDWVLTPTGKKSTKKEYLTADRFRDPEVYKLLTYRNRLKTCLGTFLENWLEMAEACGGNLHTDWNQVRSTGDAGNMGARTGRMSCHPNFMNIPNDFYVETPHDLVPLPSIRSYVLPDDDDSYFAGRDYSQQEIRILAHFENDKLMAAYNENPRMDVHDFVGAEIERLTGMKLSRKAVKTLNFGLIYGMGASKLAESMGISKDEATKVRRALRAALPGIAKLESEVKALAKLGEPITTWGGRDYHAEPEKFVDGQRMSFEYKLLNYLIQGSAADCTKEALILYDKVKKHGRLLVQVHDEINISVPKEHLESELKILEECMGAVKFDLPLLSDAKYGLNWGDAEEAV